MASKSRQAVAISSGGLERRQMPHASQNPESRVWQKVAKRLAKSRLVLDPVAVAADDDGRDGDCATPSGLSSGHAALNPHHYHES